MWRDVRYAWRGLRRSPVLTLAAATSLGLAIGANATIFSLIDGLWLRPPGVRNPSELVWIFATTRETRRGTLSFPEYQELRDQATSFAGVVARGRRGALLQTDDGSPELLLANVVSTNFFTTLGVQPALGRLFAPGDEHALEQQPGLVLGYAFWQRRFGGDPAIVGRTVILLREEPVPLTVLGVLPKTFRDLEAATDRDLWLPPQTWTLLAGRREFERREDRWFEVLGRLRPGVPVAAAQAEVQTLAATMATNFPETNAGRQASVVSDRAYRLEVGGVNAVALVGLVLLVVLITCVNVANLLLARAASRAREIAVRLAIGSSRWRLIRQLMAESALLGVLGTALGVAVAVWLTHLLPAVLVEPPGLRSLLLFQVDRRVLGFTLAVTLVTTVLFGLAPALVGTRIDLVSMLRAEAGLGVSPRRHRAVRAALVAGQIAVSLVLLSGAAVLTRSFVQTRRADLGFERKPLLLAWVTFADLPPALAQEAVRRLEALPGVRHVAVAIRAPLSLSGGGRAEPVLFPDRPADPATGPPEIKYNAVSANYFLALGTRVLRGRAFTDADQSAGPPVVVVSDRFARQYFPTGDAVGQVLRLGGAGGVEHRIVGVVQDVVINQISEGREPYFYLPFWRDRHSELTFLIDSAHDPAALGMAVRETLRALDRRLAPRFVITMAQLVQYSARNYQMTAALVGALGFIGLLLTGLGVYGVVAYATTQRVREFGIRVALGAGRGELLRLILGEGMRLGVFGFLAGVPLTLVGTRLVQSFLFDTRAWDPTSFALATAVLGLTLCAATLVPAWRATHLDPAIALREA